MNRPLFLDCRDELYEEVYENAYCITELIHPSDVDEHAGSWEEVTDEALEREISQYIVDDGKHYYDSHIATETAIAAWLDDMPRVKMEHMKFDYMEEALIHGYWPNKLSSDAAMNKLDEMLMDGDVHLPSDAMDTVQFITNSAVADKYDPRVDEPGM